MIQLFNTVLYQPIYNLLVFLYNIVPGNDIGLAIIALTIIIKVILYPFGVQAIKAQKQLQDIQPKLDELKSKHKDDKEKLASETMKIYKEQKVNPLSSCLPLLIQFPFLIAVYHAFRTGLASSDLNLLYSFVPNPGHINSISAGIIDLAVPSILLAVLAGAAQFVQTKMMPMAQPKIKTDASKDESMMASMNKSMLYFMPVMTIIIGINLPAGLTLYWLLTTVLTTVQQKILFRKKQNMTTIVEAK
ncbi:YidC/Oxa1 family membrane protein insertase [Patescibacteria group bacterium]|nr:YidC/Oxa1 family membrane protein insertase [Patescibacteria group bacterium]